jgi:serine/threonine protein kinase/tetratricopeptide (TPR) repeat protein
MGPTGQPIDSILAAAVEITSEAERREYVERACAGNPERRRRVEELIDNHFRAGSFLESPPSGLTTTATDPAAAERPGTVVGPYKLLERIGEGGMGEVWMAQQQEPVRRVVAVKLIKPGMDSRQVLARFEAERQALSLMDHPNIAKVLEAGATPEGRPYFVMELVRGAPITRCCDERRLTPRQRLELFIPVCRAVQHAHQKGVIHRDLKPSNVLVALYDDRPVPKVIDFGVAKATGQQLSEETLHTGFGAVVGTLEYMSPEQASFNQLDVDTRSDIYSLGVLLYELLTGSPPFSKKELGGGGVLELLRLIREQEPTKPSAMLSTAEGLPTLAANRGTEPKRLTKLMRGELDWVVMRALEKDRNRRYETANAFALDLQRYLADEVVAARPPSAGYRLRKFVRRNKGPVAAAVALAVSLAVGVGAVVAVRAQADRDRAADRAAREAGTTASVAAAVREARGRAEEAWDLHDHPERMRLVTDGTVAAMRRADEFAADGLPTEATRAELASAHQVVDELVRHRRLVCAAESNRVQFAQEFTFRIFLTHQAWKDFCDRQAKYFQEFGLDPISQPVDEVARTVAASRVRDSLLGMLLEWHQNEDSPRGIGPDGSPIRDRLAHVIRSTRHLCGGAYAEWQNLLDGNDVPGLVSFAASAKGLSFRAPLVGALSQDLKWARQYSACRAFLRAAVDRYPDDVWLHHDLYLICQNVQPPDYVEALRHASAASVLRSDNALFHAAVGDCYFALGSYDQAVAACDKAINLNPDAAYLAYITKGGALSRKKDSDGAIAAFREAYRLYPDLQPPRALRSLVSALMNAGRYTEALQELLAAFRRHPAWANQTGANLRYDAARAANNCADGKGVNPPPPAERPACRKQALELLTAELAAIRRLAAAQRGSVHEATRRWLVDKDLASVRDSEAVAKLPPEERDAWNKLWAEVRDLRDLTAPPAGPPRPAK